MEYCYYLFNFGDSEVCCISEEYPHEIDDLEGVNIYEAEV